MTTLRAVVNLRAWPGVDEWKRPTQSAPYSPRFAERTGLVLFAAADVESETDVFGLGAYLEVSGPSVLGGGLIIPDGLSDGQRNTIERWALSHPVDTVSGSRPMRIETLKEFCEPKAGTFNRRAYSGAWWCVGSDFGRTFGLMSDHQIARNGKNGGSWEIWLPGWGRRHADGGMKRIFPHHPPLRISSRRVGWQVQFGPCEKGAGKRINGRAFRGNFIDVMSLAYSFDADRGASFAEHREDSGLSPFDLPITVPVDANGADSVTGAVQAIHELVLTLDGEAGRWFTTSSDRTVGRGRVDLSEITSPGRLAAEIPLRFGVQAPLDTFALSDDEHTQWAETFHGGWCDALRPMLGVPFPAVSVDLSSAFPLVAHHLRWWDLVTAERIERRDVTNELRALCERVISEPTAALDPASWELFGCSLVEVIPDEEPFPVEFENVTPSDGQSEVLPLDSKGLPMFYPGADVLSASIQSKRVPHILSATAYVPVGRQPTIRRGLNMLPELVLDAENDPAIAIVQRRRKAKEARDVRLSALLRVVVNSLVFGNLCRFDESLRREGGRWVKGERPGPWSCLPIASSVTAGARLLLAVFDRMVSDRGGVVAYRDTDSSIVPASPEGDSLPLPDGSTLRGLSWAQIDSIIEAFEPLALSPDWPVWTVERAHDGKGLRAVVYGLKKHIEFTSDDGNITIVDRTEVGLGGFYSDPPSLRGRDSDGRRAWTKEAARDNVAFTLGRRSDPNFVRSQSPPWDDGRTGPFPALRRLTVTSPDVLRSLPHSLGARMGTRYIEAMTDVFRNAPAPVALDPGGDLTDWRSLRFVNRATDTTVRVTFDACDHEALCLDTLSGRAITWTSPGRSFNYDLIEVCAVCHVGHVSGIIDAQSDGRPDASSHRPVYDGDVGAAFVVSEVKRLGPSKFTRRYDIPLRTANGIAAGRVPSSATVRKVGQASHKQPKVPTCMAVGCDESVLRTGALYCSPECRKREKAKRYRAKSNGGPRKTAQCQSDAA